MSGKRFLLVDKKVGEDRIIVFAIDAHLKLLNKAKFWQIDGTFDVVPNCFRQLVTILAPLSEDEKAPTVPCLYIVMSKKTSVLYTKAFEAIKYELCRLQIHNDPTYIYSDFEIGLINSLHKVFNNSSLQGCNVHLRRIIWRNVQKFGYRKKYLQSLSFNKKVFKIAKKKLGNAPKLVTWFEKNYIGKKLILGNIYILSNVQFCVTSYLLIL